MRLQLDRDIVFFDLETTGVEVTDRIIELYAIRLTPEGRREEVHEYIHPGIPIPAEATEIHGITDAMVADKPRFGELADRLSDFFSDADLAGYNIRRFDVPLLMEEFHRCARYPIRLQQTRIVDPYVIFQKKEPRDLSSALRFYCGQDPAAAHSARADVEMTMQVFESQLERYSDLEPDVAGLDRFAAEGYFGLDGKFRIDRQGRVIFNFGKNRGKPVSEDPDYLEWMYRKSDFPVHVRAVAGELWRRIRG
jgi:DNA polymerase-3 subunit epsilon